jgi:hypothetical protein
MKDATRLCNLSLSSPIFFEFGGAIPPDKRNRNTTDLSQLIQYRVVERAPSTLKMGTDAPYLLYAEAK